MQTTQTTQSGSLTLQEIERRVDAGTTTWTWVRKAMNFAGWKGGPVLRRAAIVEAFRHAPADMRDPNVPQPHTAWMMLPARVRETLELFYCTRERMPADALARRNLLRREMKMKQAIEGGAPLYRPPAFGSLETARWAAQVDYWLRQAVMQACREQTDRAMGGEFRALAGLEKHSRLFHAEAGTEWGPAKSRPMEKMLPRLLLDTACPLGLSLPTFPEVARSMAASAWEGGDELSRLALADWLDERGGPAVERVAIEEMARHLRRPHHYRCCWVLNFVLGGE